MHGISCVTNRPFLHYFTIAALSKLDSEQDQLEDDAIKCSGILQQQTGSDCHWTESVETHNWLSLVRQKGDIVGKEAELVRVWREEYLDELHSDIEFHLRCLIERPDSQKVQLICYLKRFFVSQTPGG